MLSRSWWVLLCLSGLVACSRSGEPTELSPTPTLAPTERPTAVGPSSALDWSVAMLPDYADDVDAALEARVTRYEIDLSVDLATLKIQGDETIRYTNTEDVPLTEIYLRLYLNELGLGPVVAVSDVALDGSPLEPVSEAEGAVLRLPLPAALKPGQTVTLTLAFRASLPGEQLSQYIPWSLGQDLLACAYLLPTIPVYDAGGWDVDAAPVYGDRTYTDVALYRVRLTVPTGVTPVASGVCQEGATLGADAVTYTCVGGPMRDFVVVLGTLYETVTDTVEGVLVSSHYLPGDQVGGEQALEYAIGALSSYSQRFGPYPYDELDVVAAELPASGLEFPGLVMIAPELYGSDQQRLQWVVAHEVAHQWWYGLVGSDQIEEPWLDEALTEYSTLLYIQDTYGPEAAAQVAQENFIAPYERIVANGDDMPVGLPVAAYPERLYWDIVYRKGALFFDALRREMGDEAFAALLRSYFNRHRYQIATSESLMSLAEALSGPGVRALYERWILGSVGP